MQRLKDFFQRVGCLQIDSVSLIMFVYIILFVLTTAFALLSDKSYRPQIGLVSIVLLLSFVLGLRDFGVGTDTLVYPETYFTQAGLYDIFEIIWRDEGFDLGYMLLAYIATFISSDSHSMLFITELFIISMTVIGVWRLKQILNFYYCIYFLLYCLMFLNPSLNYMRQYCAVSILLIGFSFLLEQKWKEYSLFQIIAFFFHSSSLLFLIVPFFIVINNRTSVKVRNIIIVSFFAFVISSVIAFYEYLQLFSTLGLVSETYGERYGEVSEFSGGNLYGPAYILYILLNYTLLYYSYKMELMTRDNVFLAICLYTSSVIFFYTSTYIVFLNRLALFFDYIVIVYLAVMLSAKEIPVYFRGALLFLQIYLWARMYVIANSSETMPFTSEILGIGLS